MNIFEKFTAPNVVYSWEENRNGAPYLGELFFPSTRQKGLKFANVKGKDGTPVALVPANWNTDVLYRDRVGVTTLEASLPFFKEAYAIDEELRQEILSVKDEYVEPLVRNVFKDTDNLLEGAEVSVEVMRWQLLSLGTIAINANGVDKAYNYGFDSSTQFKTLTTLWSAESAKPIKSIIDAKKEYKNLTGEVAKYIVMSDTVFDSLASSTEVISYFQGLANPIQYPTDEEVKAYIERRLGLQFIIQDKVYKPARKFGGSDVKYYPEDRFTLLSRLEMGRTLYGTTPEEADIISKDSNSASGYVTSKGVAVTTWKQIDPVNVNVKVSEVVVPTCENIDKLYIVKCL